MIDNPYSKYYPAPLKSDDYSYVWTAGGNMAFDWQDELCLPPSSKDAIVTHLNGESIAVPGFKGTFFVGSEDGGDAPMFTQQADGRHNTIWYCCPDGSLIPVMRVRGWGHLTGCGGYNLSYDKASKIQDGFLEWTVARLNEKDYEAMGLENADLIFDREIAEAEYHVRREERRRQYADSICTAEDKFEREYTRQPLEGEVVEDCLYVPYDSSSAFWSDYSSKPHVPRPARVNMRAINQPWYSRFDGKRKRKR